MTVKFVIAALLLLIAGTGLYHTLKPLPDGISYRGSLAPLVNPTLLTDVTVHQADGSSRLEHTIFDEVLRQIAHAERFILVDMFLFNDSKPEGASGYRPLARQLTEALIQRKQALPDIHIVVISDPINTFYGGTRSPWFEALSESGITVVETNLARLRDSNPAWSGLWRVCCQWLGNSADGGWLPNALQGQPVTLRSYLALPNFKANHRKLMVTDDGDAMRALVTSANPHDGSSRHSNIGLSFTGAAVADLLASERAVLEMSGVDTALIARTIADIRTRAGNAPAPAGDDSVQVVTESAILSSALGMIASAGAGDRVDLAVFYLSHRQVVQALIEAHQRNGRVRILLDANNDAFGHEKNGIPNRQVAAELTRAGLPVRWCNTRGEQCHSKLLITRDSSGNAEILLGSANLTRRNLDDLNLETNVHLRLSASSAVAAEAVGFFERHWQQGPDSTPVMSQPYEIWADGSRLRYWRYRLMEATGLSTF
ncbi:MAG: phospholipase D-like domain-containing protein [Marinobacter sp.]|uniref:phospholipase D-like domain-containing protein n=1 Tax=Marinobacter sp. TaxID=50741 RepID=UPI003C535D29